MNVPASPLFRGSRAVADVIGRMKPLADHLKSFHPTCMVLTLARRDLDTLRRYPDAARAAEVNTAAGCTFWRGFELRADRSAPRKTP